MSDHANSARDDERIPQCLSAQQLAERLGVTSRHIYRMADRGAIPCVRVGRRMVFPEREVKEALGVRAEET